MSEVQRETPRSMGARITAEIRGQMGRRNIRQRHLAEALGRDEMWLSRRFTGDVPWTIDDLEAICVVFNMEVIDLLIGAQSAPEPTALDRRTLRRRRSAWNHTADFKSIAETPHLESVRDLAA